MKVVLGKAGASRGSTPGHGHTGAHIPTEFARNEHDVDLEGFEQTRLDWKHHWGKKTKTRSKVQDVQSRSTQCTSLLSSITLLDFQIKWNP